MDNYKKINLYLIFLSIGLITFLGILSFSSIQKEKEETEKIELFLASFEDLNQYQQKDSLQPQIVTYSQLKNFNKNDNYIHNKKDVSKSVTTYSKENKKLPPKKHYDVSKLVSSYKTIPTEKKKKKYDVSKLVTVHSKPIKKAEKPRKKIIIKSQPKIEKPVVIQKIKTNKTPKKVIVKKKVKKELKKQKIVQRKKISEKAVTPSTKTTPKKQPIVKRKIVTTPIKKRIIKKETVIKKSVTAAKRFVSNPNTKTLLYKKPELNKATNINYIQYAPIYPNCNPNLSEDDKKACLLTNVSKFVLENFNVAIGKKAGLKKGFHEIRVLFIIDKNGSSKAYKVLGKYNNSVKNEIKRIINKLPKMIPGKTNGKNVPVKYSVKVLFEVK